MSAVALACATCSSHTHSLQAATRQPQFPFVNFASVSLGRPASVVALLLATLVFYYYLRLVTEQHEDKKKRRQESLQRMTGTGGGKVSLWWFRSKLQQAEHKCLCAVGSTRWSSSHRRRWRCRDAGAWRTHCVLRANGRASERAAQNRSNDPPLQPSVCTPNSLCVCVRPVRADRLAADWCGQLVAFSPPHLGDDNLWPTMKQLRVSLFASRVHYCEIHCHVSASAAQPFTGSHKQAQNRREEFPLYALTDETHTLSVWQLSSAERHLLEPSRVADWLTH